MNLKYLILFFSFLFSGCGEIPVDWTPTFDSIDKIPFGTYVLREELPTIFPDSKIQNINTKTRDFFEKIQYEYRDDHYVFIYPANIFSDSAWIQILNYVNRGGSALISNAQEIPVFEKYLKLKFAYKEKKEMNLGENRLSVGKRIFSFDKTTGTTYFSDYDEDKTDVLGYLISGNEKKPNFIKVYYGNGYFLLHTEPFVFTNYQMLRGERSEYAAEVFSYMEDADILWDNHRIGRRQNSTPKNGGFFDALSFILKHQSLRWAFYLLLVSGILFLIFNSKRKQKAVPVLLPYTNYTLDFAKTLSELYRYNSDHTAMVKYKINFFLEQIKTRYNITSKDTEKDFSELLSAKSGVNLNLCEKLVLTIDIFRNKNYLDKEDFYKLQTLIESFNQNSNLYGRKSK